jgi:hypothetical protein
MILVTTKHPFLRVGCHINKDGFTTNIIYAVCNNNLILRRGRCSGVDRSPGRRNPNQWLGKKKKNPSAPGGVVELGHCPRQRSSINLSRDVRCGSERMVRSQDHSSLRYHVGIIQ